MTRLSDLYAIGNTIDTFAPGHYARVYSADYLRREHGVAFKVMRAEHIGEETRWEMEAFLNEADLLASLADLPAVVRLYDCGYIESAEAHPSEGEIISCGLDVDAFRAAFYPHIRKRWRPYLALEELPRQHNLFYVMKPSGARPQGRLPTEEGLALALQFGELLYHAHQRGIVYLDHKLEHLYWDGEQLRVIDWNSSKRVGGMGQPAEVNIVNDLHNLCVGILYPVFTGASPLKGMLRPMPGSQQQVESRYEGVTELDFGAEPTLSKSIQHLIEAGAEKRYQDATGFLAECQRVAVRFGWNFPGQSSAAPLRDARERTRAGLAHLRESQAAARLAREHLLEAATLDGIHEDVENELRRLLAAIGDFLNARPIP